MQESSKITWQARGALLWHQQQHSPPKKAVRSSLVSSVTTAKYTHDHLEIFLHQNNLAVNWQMRSCDILWREKNHLPFLFHHKSLILIRHVYMQICIRAENRPSVCVCMCVWVVLEHRPVLQCMCYKNWKQLNGKVQIRCQSCTVLGESVLLERCLQSHKLCDKTPSSAKPPKQTINHTRDAGRIYFQKHDSQTDSRKERKPYSLPIHSLAS